MGKVFSPEQIASAQYPEIGAQVKAGRFVLDCLMPDPDSLSIHNYVHSAMVYGSTAEGRANRRSDLDVMINYHGYHAEVALPHVRDVLNQTEAAYKTPIEHNIYQVGALFNTYQHNFDPLFARYLVEAQSNDGWSINNPADPLSHNLVELNDFESLRRVVLKFCAMKTRQFAGVLSLDRGKIDYTTLQRAFEVPVAVSRKLKPLYFKDSSGEELLLDSAARLRMTPPIFREDAGDKQDDLREMDQEYSQVLEETIGGERTLDSYRRWINERYMWAFMMAHDVTIAWVSVLEKTPQTIDDYLELNQPIPPDSFSSDY